MRAVPLIISSADDRLGRSGGCEAGSRIYVYDICHSGRSVFQGWIPASKVCVLREYDRAAPNGTGTIKVGGNYAASLVAGEIAHSKGIRRRIVSGSEREEISG